MKRAVICVILLSLILFLAGCFAEPGEEFSIDSVVSYQEIPGVTAEEIAAIEALKLTRRSFSYGQMHETEAFLLQNGSYAGFSSKFCKLLSELFDIDFRLNLYYQEGLMNGLDSMRIDFTGDLAPTAELQEIYYMSHPIAERPQRIYTHQDSDEIIVEADINGLTVGFLKGGTDAARLKTSYPDISYKSVEVADFAAAAAMLESGEIDVFISEGVFDPVLCEYKFIKSKEFFPLVYAPVSLATADPELEPIITVVNKYLACGGIDKLFQLYREGDAEYAIYKLSDSFTEEEKAYLKELSRQDSAVRVALETDNYPICFYNQSEEAFQGIAVDVLREIGDLTGIKFEVATDKDSSWAQILDMLKTGEVSMVSQLLKTDERANDFIWAKSPYTFSYYALLSKAEFMNLAIYQVARARVGVISETAYEDKYIEWFQDSDNLMGYENQDDALHALETGEIDLLMASNYVLLTQLNYRETPGYKLNVTFNVQMDSYYGFNINEDVLCSIISKAQEYVNTGTIVTDWTNRGFDYSKKLTQERMVYLMIILAVLICVLGLTIAFLLRNRKFSRGLEELVQKRTHELERQTEAAHVASKAKSSFLAKMSHEIRTPLNAIIGMAGIARNSVSDPEKSISSINQIISSSQHLLGILNDVLDMSKIESGKLELTREPFGLLKAHIEVSDIIAHRCVEKNISYKTNTEEIGDIVLIGDKLRLNQVLINLLGNAVKFTPEGGEITFLASIQEENEKHARIRFSVSDNGIGMSEAQVSKLFIPFEQTDNSITVKYGGTGLGLSISQNLVGMMGGVIKVESKPQEGSTFYFDLDFEKSGEAIQEDEAAPEALDFEGKRILLVEDVEINRVILCEILAPTGAYIDEAENGQHAIEIFENSNIGHYDLILMDVQMPILNGYQATKRIRVMRRADAEAIPVIALTANAYKEDVEMAMSAGMNGHLSKPIDIGSLMSTLAKYLKD